MNTKQGKFTTVQIVYIYIIYYLLFLLFIYICFIQHDTIEELLLVKFLSSPSKSTVWAVLRFSHMIKEMI